ncbi:MAG: HEPN domain-containing protein [Chloroflexota bacterium]|nr:MAG: HEPN domain-containing protein [Chloroflexota bacterium]
MDALPRIVSRLVRRYHPVEVVLFGSCARGDAGPDSDVDLLLVVDADQEHNARATVFSALGDASVSKDVVVTTPERLSRLGHVRGLVYRNALREGRRLYRRRGARTPWWEKAREGAMTPEEVATETQRWLARADEDLLDARSLLRSRPRRTRGACFHAQQSVEKTLKAALIWRGIEPSRTHDLPTLAGLVGSDLALPINESTLKRMTAWAVDGRYPGEAEPSRPEAVTAINDARDTLARVREMLTREGLASTRANQAPPSG